MKKIISFFLLGATMFSLSGCGKKVQAGEKEKVVPVKTMEAQEENHPILLEYLGNTNSKDTVKYSFKIAGTISAINVKEGDFVNAGDVIASLDSKDYNFALKAARGQMDAATGQMNAAQGKISMAQSQVAAAKAQYEKALNGAQVEDINRAKLGVENANKTYNYAKQSFDRVKKLYEEGIVSKQEFDDIKIKVDSAKIAVDNAKAVLSKAQAGARSEDKQSALAQLNAAKAQVEAAKSQYDAAKGQVSAAKTQCDAKSSMVSDTTLTSGISGYVIKVLNKAGENTAAGYPVVAIRSDDEVIETEFSQSDITKIKLGTKASIKINDITVTGSVAEIEQTPDPKSRTYKGKIKLDKKLPKDKFLIGSVAKVNIKLTDKKGIWLPITTILNDGEDYVYVASKGRVSRKNVTIESIYGDKALIKGLSLGDEIITEGLKNVKPGYKVKIVK